MQRLQGWVRYAAENLPRPGTPQQQQQQDSDDEDFIYARVQVHSDDEDTGPVRRTSSRRISAPEPSKHSDDLSPSEAKTTAEQPPHEQHHHSQLPAVQLKHLHSHSDGELIHLDSSGQHQQRHREQTAGIDDLLQDHCNNSSSHGSKVAETSKLARADNLAGTGLQSPGPSWEVDWDAGNSNLAGVSTHQQQPAGIDSRITSSNTNVQQQQRIDSNNTASTSGTGGDSNSSRDNAGAVHESQAEEELQEIPDHEHSQTRRELIIYAIPLERGKVIFLPVCPWRLEPEQHKGLRKVISGHMGRVQGEASDIWQRMAAAEKGTIANRFYKLGKRVLDSVSPEERLMRGVPKDISKVVIHHPTSVTPDAIMQQMQTMTKSYGIKAVGKAAAATLMLPLAMGVDLIILPGPQVLTYYTMWELYRNTNGALGTSRMTKFITQGGDSESIRVSYVEESRLDKYYDLANDCPEGVLSEDDIEHLVIDLREPDLAEALLSLRHKALREFGRRTSKGGEEYVSLPPTDPAVAQALGSRDGGQAGNSSRRVSFGL